MAGSTISTKVTIGVTLGAGVYTSPLIITSTGAINPSGYGVTGLYAGLPSGIVLNQGAITGGYGIALSGAGVEIDGSTVTNDGNIMGGSNGQQDYGFAGAGVYLLSGALTNSIDGVIRGGTSNVGFDAQGGTAGDGIILLDGQVTNAGKIAAGNEARSSTGVTANGPGSVGALLEGGTMLNTGKIVGGNGGNGLSYTDNSGGSGVNLDGAMLSNAGTIMGGAGGLQSREAGGDGVTLIKGSLTNTGIVLGGAGAGFFQQGGPGGTGLAISGGVADNSGILKGGNYGFGVADGAGGAGVVITSGTLTNTGGIVGTPGGGASVAPGAGGDGVNVQGGTVINDGTITGGYGINKLGDGVFLNGGTLIDAGTIIGGFQKYGMQTALAFGSSASALIVDPGAEFFGAVTGSAADELQLGAGTAATVGTLNMGTSFIGLGTLKFDTGASWQLSGGDVALADAQKIDGFTARDTLFLEGFIATSDTYVSGVGLELSNGVSTQTLDITGGFTTDSFDVTAHAGGTEIVICYLSGTRILTSRGEVAIEDLNVGDHVITRFNGAQPIKWIGQQNFARRFLDKNKNKRPVRIGAGALGNRLPRRDLYVSPGHSMLLGETLVLAKHLVNGVTITQDETPEDVHYYQLEFSTHDCVLAEGAWSESYADCPGLRAQFHNAASFHRLYPNDLNQALLSLCAPRPESGLALDLALRPSVVWAAAGLPPGRLRGWIDQVTDAGTITGWAQDIAYPQLPVLLHVLLDHQTIGTVLACDHRGDLEEAGIAEGRCSFSYSLSKSLPPGASSRTRVKRIIDGAEIHRAGVPAYSPAHPLVAKL